MGEPRRFSVHLALGGGKVADVLLWKKWHRSVVLLVSSTFLWFLFQRAGYNLLSFISNGLFLLVVILFFWAKSALLLNRPPPPVPNLELSEEIAVKAADEMRVLVNNALSIAHGIAIGGNLRLASVLLCLSLPVLYDKYQNLIDDKLNAAYKIARIQYRIIDEKVLSKIPLPPNMEKKIQ
ncbi:hypothetical protein DH2020_006588 [Rehmannia glutinosa]|uniref:Reticulon-like protein n=1 Tax=Rehmannia glutinosa TaxID=99300 RepID=A0ABR0XJA0_REHGL